MAVLSYRAPYDEPSGPTVIDIFKGLAAIGLMLLFLALALGTSVLPLSMWSKDAPSGYTIAASAILVFLLLVGASLSYRSARDCFTGAIRRSPVRPANDKRPEA